MFTNPLWIKGIGACHREKPLPWNKLRLAIVELNDPMLHGLLPGCTHSVIQNSRVGEGHFWTRMCHPLLDENQAHSVVDKFDSFRVAKRMKAKVKKVSLFIQNVVL